MDRMGVLEKLDLNRIPQHVAIIMDGNGRWAENQGKVRTFGHWQGVEPVKDTIEGAIEIGIRFLTLFAFSTENWTRPSDEVKILMEILVDTLHREIDGMMENGIQLKAMGQLEFLPESCQLNLAEAMERTKNNNRLTLNLALSYGSRWELLKTMKTILTMAKKGELEIEDINENLINSLLCTAGMPDPDLLIRTSGENRVSNFLLWQIAYTEFYFMEKYWPEFTRQDLFQAVLSYQNRVRRFGYTDQQIKEMQNNSLSKGGISTSSTFSSKSTFHS